MKNIKRLGFTLAVSPDRGILGGAREEGQPNRETRFGRAPVLPRVFLCAEPFQTGRLRIHCETVSKFCNSDPVG